MLHHGFQTQKIRPDLNKRHVKTKKNYYRIVISLSVYKNCAEVYESGDKISGVYKIDPDGLGEFEVFCDEKTAGGGWTVFQKGKLLVYSFILFFIVRLSRISFFSLRKQSTFGDATIGFTTK